MIIHPARSIWWMNPAVAMGAPCILAAAAAVLISPASYSTLWRTPKFIDAASFLEVVAMVTVFVLGSFIGGSRKRDSEWNGVGERWRYLIPWDRVEKLFTFSFWTCITGYALWAAIGIRNGLTLRLVLDGLTGREGAVYSLYNFYLAPVAGVTTLSQLGIAAVVLGVPLGLIRGWRFVRVKVGIIILLALLRAMLHSERIGLIEVLVPFAVSMIWLKSSRTNISARWHRFILFGPLWAGLLLIVVFSAFEYSRSWLGFYAAQESTGFARFAMLRLAGYYSTAINNGVLLTHTLGQPIGEPYYTFTFALRFPILNQVVLDFLPTSVPDQDSLLQSAGNPEFNNPSGIFSPVIDFGFPAALLYWFFAGLISGYLHKMFLNRSASGLFLYPIIFLSLVETSRILYWADGRAFPPLVFLAVSLVFIVRPVIPPALYRTPVGFRGYGQRSEPDTSAGTLVISSEHGYSSEAQPEWL